MKISSWVIHSKKDLPSNYITGKDVEGVGMSLKTLHIAPEFVPFFGHFLPLATKFVDDGLHKTIFQMAFDLLNEKPKEQV